MSQYTAQQAQDAGMTNAEARAYLRSERGEKFISGEQPNTWKNGAGSKYNMFSFEAGGANPFVAEKILDVTISSAKSVLAKPLLKWTFNEFSNDIELGWNYANGELRIVEYDPQDIGKILKDITFYRSTHIYKDNLTGEVCADYEIQEEKDEEENIAWTVNLDEVVVTGKKPSSITETIGSTINPSYAASTVLSTKNVATTTAAGLTKSATKIVGAYKLGADALELLKDPSNVSDLAASLISDATSHLTKQASMLVGKYSQKITALVANVPAEIGKFALKRFNMTVDDIKLEFDDNPPKYWSEKQLHKLTLGEAIEELGGNLEKKTDKERKEKKETKTKKFINDTLQKVPQITNDVMNFVDNAASGFDEIMGHITEGPEWLEKEMNRVIDDKLGKVDKELNKVYKEVQTEVNKFNKNVGYFAGKEMVIVYNAGIMTAAKTARYLMSKTTAKTQAKAKQLVQVAKIQLMSKLNIELPL